MNDFVVGGLMRERQEDYMRQAEHDRLVAELRQAAAPARTEERPEARSTAVPAREPVAAHRWLRTLVHRVHVPAVLHGRPL